MEHDTVAVERLKPNGDISYEDAGRVNDLILGFNKIAKVLELKTYLRLTRQNDLFVARGDQDPPWPGRILGMVLLARIPTLSHGKAGQAGEIIIDRALSPERREAIRTKLIQHIVEHAEERGFEMLYLPHATPEDRAAFKKLFPEQRLFEMPTWCVNLVPNGTA